MKDEPGPSPTHFMGMKIFPLAIVLTVLAIVSGCAKTTGHLPPYYGPTQTMAQVIGQINANNAKISTLRAAHSFEATLVDNKGKSRTFSGDGYLLFTKPANLL